MVNKTTERGQPLPLKTFAMPSDIDDGGDGKGCGAGGTFASSASSVKQDADTSGHVKQDALAPLGPTEWTWTAYSYISLWLSISVQPSGFLLGKLNAQLNCCALTCLSFVHSSTCPRLRPSVAAVGNRVVRERVFHP